MEPKIPDQGIVPNSAERFSIESVRLCFANRPAGLPEQQHGAFLAVYGERLATAYPPGPHGTPFPFRRLFFIAQRA